MLKIEFKTILRWVCILFFLLAYYIWLSMACFPYPHVSSPEYQHLSNQMSVAYHHAIIADYREATYTVYHASVWGYLVCTSLILFEFNKIRIDPLPQTSKSKTLIRWAGIISILFIFYLWLSRALLSFSHIIYEKENIILNEPVTLKVHKNIIYSIMHSINILLDVATWGFIGCIILVLLLFKKVR